MAVASGRSPRSEERAFEHLYRQHVAAVYRYALTVLRDPSDAEDVTQTTFLNAYRAYKRGERPRKPENWLLTIAHNVCRQRFRQGHGRPAHVELVEDHFGALEADESVPSPEELRRAFDRLPPRQREALVLRELEGRHYAEIAAALGLTPSALETLLFRARRALREQLEEQITCSEAAFSISKQADGELGRSERRALRRHLRSCPACRGLAQRQTPNRQLLRGLVAIPLPMSLHSLLGRGAEVSAAAGGGATAAGKVAALAAAVTIAGGGAYEADVHVAPLFSSHRAKPARVVRQSATQKRSPASGSVAAQRAVSRAAPVRRSGAPRAAPAATAAAPHAGKPLRAAKPHPSPARRALGRTKARPAAPARPHASPPRPARTPSARSAPPRVSPRTGSGPPVRTRPTDRPVRSAAADSSMSAPRPRSSPGRP